MSNQSRHARFQITADRQNASRRVRYVETSQMADGECVLCQLDEGQISMNQTEIDTDEGVEQELIQAIENQLAAGEPEFVQATLNKLTLVGYEREESISLMSQVLAWEIASMLEQKRSFDLAVYEAALRALPELPS
ncbi:hypothetical protein VQ643_01880 [Pseudomonas sp. F1_0610]|uniref:hypothetical protein n=1 Tax=Pseudomonas sp. F1_0610 TaxID=3114284 RepID=UPI0039C17934